MLYAPVAAMRRFRKRVIVEAGTAMIDFVNGTYTVDGAAVTAADVVDDTGRIGASGLSILRNDEVAYLGAFRDLLFTGNWTVIIEVDVAAPESTSHANYFIQLEEGFSFAIIKTTNQEIEVLEWNNDEAETRELFPSGQGVTGINKIAVTRTANLLAVSMNGAEADSVEQAFTDIDYATAIGAFHDATSDPSGHIRSIEITAPQAAAALPALSAL